MGSIIEALQGGLTILVGLIFVAFLIALIAAIPFLLIWCLNTLGIASASYGLMEWLAAFILTAFFFGGSGSSGQPSFSAVQGLATNRVKFINATKINSFTFFPPFFKEVRKQYYDKTIQFRTTKETQRRRKP